MAIPSNQMFEAFLTGCAVTHTPAKAPFVSIDGGMHVTSDRAVEVQPYLAYPNDGLQLESMLKQVSTTLRAQGCLVDDRIAISALALAVASRGSTMPAVAHVTRFLTRTHSAKLMQHVVMPGTPRPDYELSLGKFRIRPFAADRISYWAKRCGSTYPIDLRELNSQASLECDPFDVLLLECQATDLWAGVSIDPAFLHQLVDCYYAAVARAFASRVSEEVKRDLLVFQSAALVWIDVEELLNHLLVQVVSLFTWKADGKLVGWATYASQSVVHSNFIPPEILSASRGWLSSELGFDGLSNDKPLDQTIRTYCTFLQRAHSHKFAGRRDEALLLFVVALDLLLGLKGRSSESVANHAAVLVHRQLGHSLAVTVRRIKQLYDTRSQYVHAGKPVREADLAAVDEIAMEILWTLLATSGRNEIRDTNDWIKTLGFIFSAMSAGPTIAETEFAAIGVPPIGHRRVPPIRVERAGPDSPGSVISVSVPGEED